MRSLWICAGLFLCLDALGSSTSLFAEPLAGGTATGRESAPGVTQPRTLQVFARAQCTGGLVVHWLASAPLQRKFRAMPKGHNTGILHRVRHPEQTLWENPISSHLVAFACLSLTFYWESPDTGFVLWLPAHRASHIPAAAHSSSHLTVLWAGIPAQTHSIPASVTA